MVEGQAGVSPTKYRPVLEIGRGGMATVCLALVHGPAGFNKLQVIKRLRPALAADPEFLQMFLDEARLAGRINHPNVVQTNEVGFDGQFYFIAMEYLDGQTLEFVNRTLQKTGGNLPLPMHLLVLTETLAGLHFAHELADFDGSPLNVVHRDVSPQNVMIGYDGHVKLLDFGIAKAADSSADTRTGVMKGKCAYMSPEQFGGARVDRRADVFAVGVMLWRALTGKRLWKGLSELEIFTKLSHAEIPTPRSVKDDVPEELERICMRALHPKREDRFQTAAEFQSALEDYMISANMRASEREIGKYLSDLFGDRREMVRAAVEAQVRQAPGAEARPSSAPAPASTSAEVRHLWSLIPSSASSPSDVAPVLGASNDIREAHSSAVDVPPRRRVRVSMLVSVGTAAVAVLVFAATRSLRPLPAPAAAPPLAEPAEAVPSMPQVVRLTIHATPEEAKLYLDDIPLDGNPATGVFPRDGASHRVRAEAPGYTTKREIANFDTSMVAVDVALDHEKATKPMLWSQAPRTRHAPPVAPPPSAQVDHEPVPTALPLPPAPPPKPPGPGTKWLPVDPADPWPR
jgi:serine/threonine protein kinase